MFHPADLGPGVRAGFTDRHGGVSTSPWATLNLGTNTGDDLADVRRNRARLATALGVPVVYAAQIHGNQVFQVTADDVAAARSGSAALAVAEVDALVTTCHDVGLAVLVADCVPVLLAGYDDSVAAVAVAMAHAGRRGVETGVIAAAHAALRAAGAVSVQAAIGPAVCGRCYEVPEAMQAAVADIVPEARSTTRWETPGLDLPAAVRAQLAALGVEVAAQQAICTMEDDNYYSHRQASAAGEATGRFAGVIALVAA